MFKVSDIVEKTGKSKTSVYRKISKLKTELKPHKKTLNGVIYYDEEGLKIIAELWTFPQCGQKWKPMWKRRL